MAKVSLLSTSHVSPRTPTPQPCEQGLSPIDQLPPFRNYARLVFYYREALSPTDDFSELAFKLKESLSSTLSYFYPFAGRVEVRNDKAGTLFINCNDAGIPFRTAVADCHLADWFDLVEQDASSGLESQLHDPEEFCSGNLRESDIIKVQVTKFLCGSIVLGHVISEIVMDGFSNFHFLNAWSEMHRTGKISRLPLFDSEILKARNPPKVTVPISDYVAQPAHSNCLPLVTSPPQLKIKLFAFTADKINALVHEVRNGPHCSSTFLPTSFEAMAGLVWKCITEARQLSDNEITIYNYVISLRDNVDRWSPRIPMNYMGNPIHVTSMEAMAKDIKEKHVSYTVKLVHDDICRFSVEMMKSTVDWLHVQMEKGLTIDFSCDLSSGKVVTVSSIYGCPIYDVDFGWGRPLHFSLHLEPHWGDGIVYMLPTPQGGRSRYLLVALPEEHLNRLCAQSLFLNFATPVKVGATSGFTGMPTCKL